MSAPPTVESASSPLRGHVLRALIGPTAVGKSALALDVAERSGAEIVSLDSMLVYRGMDVGTAKPDASERARVRHHMIDLVEPNERYDVQRFLRDLAPVLDDLRARGVPALFVGGTGFYLKVLSEGLFDGPDVDVDLRERFMARARDEGAASLHAELARIDPKTAARVHENDVKRVVRGLEVHAQTGKPLSEWQTQWGRTAVAPRRLVGLELPVDALDARIRARARAMFARDFADEAARVRARTGFSPTSIQALGYDTALELADGAIALDEAIERVTRATRQFARRQRTWYRKFQDAVWFEALPVPELGEAPTARRGEDPIRNDTERETLVASALRALDLVAR